MTESNLTTFSTATIILLFFVTIQLACTPKNLANNNQGDNSTNVLSSNSTDENPNVSSENKNDSIIPAGNTTSETFLDPAIQKNKFSTDSIRYNK